MAKVRKSKIGKLLQKISLAIVKIWQKIDPAIKSIVAVAVEVVNFIKEGVADPRLGLAEMILRHLFKNNDKVIDGIDDVKSRLEKILPKVILTVDFLDKVANEDDLEKKLLLIIEKIREGTPEQRKVAYSSMAALFIEEFSEGDVPYEEAWGLAQKYYSGELTA